MLDGGFIRHKTLQMLRVSLSPCDRALPRAWEVVTNKGNVALEVGDPLLDQGALLLTRMRRVTVLADRGVRDRAWARQGRALDWDSIIRLANHTTITVPGGVGAAADCLGVTQGERRSLPHVRVTLEADGTGNLVITWRRATPTCPAERCVLMTNRRPGGWVLRHDLKRKHSEESFRDDQSGRFDLHASHLMDAKRPDTLLLAIAIAVLWIYELGEHLLRADRRKEIDPPTTAN
ncbi:MAG: hypothetical protein SNJ62_03970 [Chloracidobacterium sp.]